MPQRSSARSSRDAVRSSCRRHRRHRHRTSSSSRSRSYSSSASRASRQHKAEVEHGGSVASAITAAAVELQTSPKVARVTAAAGREVSRPSALAATATQVKSPRRPPRGSSPRRTSSKTKEEKGVKATEVVKSPQSPPRGRSEKRLGVRSPRRPPVELRAAKSKAMARHRSRSRPRPRRSRSGTRQRSEDRSQQRQPRRSRSPRYQAVPKPVELVGRVVAAKPKYSAKDAIAQAPWQAPWRQRAAAVPGPVQLKSFEQGLDKKRPKPRPSAAPLEKEQRVGSETAGTEASSASSFFPGLLRAMAAMADILDKRC
mmetsp:Transcript_110168/g.355219  ORF Transcript_110168/g.355219 Transcript_110168/m.355219 type:complete len:314 (+) Transcript_110168:145-1086(+)